MTRSAALVQQYLAPFPLVECSGGFLGPKLFMRRPGPFAHSSSTKYSMASTEALHNKPLARPSCMGSEDLHGLHTNLNPEVVISSLNLPWQA
ncbi:hypothetical protein VFPPC_18438 [Pochonia chlamydosporia 170]|uniref:Uncharacterized protein n=1 Tax=Pochonia chlamydosporia 170 TaxID=1380566 RepID=A0A219ANQ2_METCM|nr:hypothetical protein VFPPC_18438 [Pochonia chlamydosporia 170]OWT42467.1 hypothetical protein VFPPC_18438 [Pochonia chlamydosporia 170]